MKLKIVIILIIICLIFKLYYFKQEKIIMVVPNLKAYKTAFNLGYNYINTINPIPNRGAVMFDIDDTLIYIDTVRNRMTPIKPMIDLLNECIRKGLLVIIITARESKYLQQTREDLDNFSINYSGLYLRKSPEDDNNYFKSKIKEKLYNDYKIDIIMSVGDNIIDILGPYSGYGLKLPNKSDPNLYESSQDGSQLLEVKF